MRRVAKEPASRAQMPSFCAVRMYSARSGLPLKSNLPGSGSCMGAHLAHAVAPVIAWDARIMDVAGADDEGFGIQHEVVRLRSQCVRSAGCKRRRQYAIGGWGLR